MHLSLRSSDTKSVSEWGPWWEAEQAAPDCFVEQAAPDCCWQVKHARSRLRSPPKSVSVFQTLQELKMLPSVTLFVRWSWSQLRYQCKTFALKESKSCKKFLMSERSHVPWRPCCLQGRYDSNEIEKKRLQFKMNTCYCCLRVIEPWLSPYGWNLIATSMIVDMLIATSPIAATTEVHCPRLLLAWLLLRWDCQSFAFASVWAFIVLQSRWFFHEQRWATQGNAGQRLGNARQCWATQGKQRKR